MAEEVACTVHPDPGAEQWHQAEQSPQPRPAALDGTQVTRKEVNGQRSDNVELLFGAERPASFHDAVAHIVGEEDQVRPTVALRRRAKDEAKRQDNNKEE